MLRITVEMVPYGIEEMKFTLSELHIINDGTASDGSGDSPIGNYQCRFYDLHPTQLNYLGEDNIKTPWVVTKIKRWRRKEKTVWELIEQSIKTLKIKLKEID